MITPKLDRRAFLASAGALGPAAGATGLSGCRSNSGPGANSESRNAAVALPDYIPYTGIKADLAATDQGVDAAFRTMPKDRPVSVPEVPGKGEKVTGLANIYYPAPPGSDKNSYWAGLNKRLGVDLSLTMVPAADFGPKFATTIAGNDLPDLLQMRPTPNLPTLLQAKFADITSLVAGSAIKDYPNLANLPASAWRWSVYNGGIYGVPIPRGIMYGGLFARTDLTKAAGVSDQPQSYAEFADLCRAVTDPKKRRWAYADVTLVGKFLLGTMSGEPNEWRSDGGKLTHRYESDEYRGNISATADLWKAGVIHPDAFGATQPVPWFAAGTTAFIAGSYLTWTQLVTTGKDTPGFAMSEVRAPKWDGGGLGPWRLGSGYFSITALKKADPDKLKLQLRVLNYLAAPFGTKEYFYARFGAEGVDHTLSDTGDPVLTKTGSANTTIPIRYLADAPAALYEPGRPGDADLEHSYQTDEVPVGVQNPTYGLFSDTYASQNQPLTTKFEDGIAEIIQGRKPLTSIDDLLKTWRSAGGDKMRTEFESQLQGGSPSPSK